MTITLKGAVGDNPAVTLNYGNFIQTLIDFIIVAFAIFLAIKAMNKLQEEETGEPPTPEPSNEEVLLTEIGNILKKQG